MAHCATLVERIRTQVGTGAISFARYMDLALYAPGLGYYSGGATKFGAAGDFVTAPELGPAFARVIAHAIAPVLRAFDHPTILELGGGSGALAADLLSTLRGLRVAPVRYCMLDRSGDLRARQAQRLAGFDVEFLDAPPTSPFDGVVIGNEVLDALAVECFCIDDGTVLERAVAFDIGLRWQNRSATPALAAAVRHIESSLGRKLPHGYASEVATVLPSFIATVTAQLRRGIALFCDYGYGRAEYYRPERDQGTLICHHQHRAHDDPFFLPGLNDISAFVDFTALAEALTAAKLHLLTYDTQAGFMLRQDLPTIFAELATLEDRSRLQLTGALKRLMLPGEMGERFKLMIAGTANMPPLPQLSAPGQRHLL